MQGFNFESRQNYFLIPTPPLSKFSFRIFHLFLLYSWASLSLSVCAADTDPVDLSPSTVQSTSAIRISPISQIAMQFNVCRRGSQNSDWLLLGHIYIYIYSRKSLFIKTYDFRNNLIIAFGAPEVFVSHDPFRHLIYWNL